MKLQQRFIHAAASRLEGSAEVVRTLLASPKEVPRQRRPRLPRRTMAGCKAFDPIPASPPCRPDRPAFAPPPPPRPRAIPGRPRFCTNELVAARANPRGRAGVRCRRSLGAGRPGPCEPDAAVLHERLAGAHERTHRPPSRPTPPRPSPRPNEPSQPLDLARFLPHTPRPSAPPAHPPAPTSPPAPASAAPQPPALPIQPAPRTRPHQPIPAPPSALAPLGLPSGRGPWFTVRQSA